MKGKSLLSWNNGYQIAKAEKKKAVINKRLTLLKENLLGSFSAHKSCDPEGAKATNYQS